MNGKMTMSQDRNFPLKVEDVERELDKEILSYHSGYHVGNVQIGPEKYFLPQKYRQMASQIYNMPLRDSDVFVITNPRSGTTWTQEMVWLINSDLDYDGAAAEPLVERFPFLEYPCLLDDKFIEFFREDIKDKKGIELFKKMCDTSIEYLKEVPSPRYIKSHLPLSLLPPALLDTCRAVYVARDPRDAAVSFYHQNRLLKHVGYTGDFKTYWNYFHRGLIIFTPYLEHIKEAWSQREHPNILFLYYEEMCKDLMGTIRKVANFLGKELTEQQVAKLVNHLSFENFKKNSSVNYDVLGKLGMFNEGEQSFIRKGKTGGWLDYFDEEMTAQAQQWLTDNLQDTDFRFPHESRVIE